MPHHFHHFRQLWRISLTEKGLVFKLMIVLTIIVLLVYAACPLIGKVVLLIINAFIPDPLPLVDEAIMLLTLGIYIDRFERLREFVSDNKALSVIIGLILLAALIWLISFVWKWIF